jgi:hypothetical protein
MYIIENGACPPSGFMQIFMGLRINILTLVDLKRS